MDPLDGTVARLTGKALRSGALFDCAMDRYAEPFVFSGLLVDFRSGWIFYLVMLALMGSLQASYVKAKGESLRFLFSDCHRCTGKGALVILTVITNLTAIPRLIAEGKELF